MAPNIFLCVSCLLLRNCTYHLKNIVISQTHCILLVGLAANSSIWDTQFAENTRWRQKSTLIALWCVAGGLYIIQGMQISHETPILLTITTFYRHTENHGNLFNCFVVYLAAGLYISQGMQIGLRPLSRSPFIIGTAGNNFCWLVSNIWDNKLAENT